MPIREEKPIWAAVPESVRLETQRTLGARVVGARRAFGGYGPSATFTLMLEDGRRAFFKGVYPLPEGSAVRWRHGEEQLVYERLGEWLSPWAPDYYGSFSVGGWNVLLIEAVRGARVPPWTADVARRAVRSYGEFHANSRGRELPDWLSREHHLDFATFWHAIFEDDEALTRLTALPTTADQRRAAERWLAANRDRLLASEAALAEANANHFALLHFDTRSDNIRVDHTTLRIFDWPDASVGPPEFDFAAFAQSMVNEGAPGAEQLTSWYSEVMDVDDDILTASIVGIAGYFADRGPRPDLPGLPRLRPHQRRQLKASLPWAARRLEVNEPDWLLGVVD